MRRALLIAHHFPPVGGGGVQRSVQFVRHMPTFGFQPVVITTPGTPAGRWSPEDPSLNEQIGGAEVHRIVGPEPKQSRGWRRRAERLLDRESEFARWWRHGVTKAAAGVAESVDVIVASLGPYLSGPIGVDVAKRFRKPLVVDLRDPWALDEVWLYASYIHRRRDLARMRRVFEASDAIVMNTREAARRVLHQFPSVPASRVTFIPNGFDPDDFNGPAPQRDDQKFRILHAGGLYAELGLSHRRTRVLRRLVGGMPVPSVDLLPRSHVVLLEAVDRLIAQQPQLKDVIEICLVGVMSDLDREIALRSPVVRMEGFQSHDRTVELLRSADLLFLPMHDLPRGTSAGLIPGKTYEYLAARRPILAAVPAGDARDLLLESEAAVVCEPSDVASMAELIAADVERWRAGGKPRRPRRDVVERYEWVRLMQELAAVMDAAVENARP